MNNPLLQEIKESLTLLKNQKVNTHKIGPNITKNGNLLAKKIYT